MDRLTLHIGRADGSYRSGETIDGHVGVAPRADVRCRRLSVALRWRAAGAAGAEGRLAGVADLGGHAWQGGRRYAFPFSLPAPQGPFSYDGELVKVSWSLEARADVPDATDLRGDASLVLAAPGDVEQALGYRDAPVAGLAAVWLGPAWKPPTGSAGTAGRPSRLRRLLGGRAAPRVDVAPWVVRAGDSVRVKVSGESADGAVGQAEVELVGTETARPRGKAPETRRLPGAWARAPLGRDAELAIPLGAAPTFEGRFHAVRWTVRVSGGVSDAAWSVDVPLAIVPR